MHWVDRIAKDIINRGTDEPYWVDDMFTPSGFAHLGSLRGPLLHELIFRALKDAGQSAKFTFIFNDFDPIDGLPEALEEKFSSYLGLPLKVAPSPEPGFESFADYFSKDFQGVLKSLGLNPQFLSSWDMYHEGKFDGVIQEALDQADKIQDIYQRVSGSKKLRGWLPLQVICQNCGKLGTTRVSDWDGKTVSYKCEEELVTWARGCKHEGRVSPFGGNGKLPWKVDWPAHWKVLAVTIEGSGKDHSSAGGSRDIARELCKKVFNYPEPYNFAYEFFLVGGKKMASSKGIGLRAHDFVDLVPLPLMRFLFARTDYRQTIDFKPLGTLAIPDLFDEYDRCWQAYNKQESDLARTFEMSLVNGIPAKNPHLFLPRFRDIANYMQLPNIDIMQKFQEVKGSPLTDQERAILDERMHYAQAWLESYAQSEYRLQMAKELPKEAVQLSKEQRGYLTRVVQLIEKDLSPDELQAQLYTAAKTQGIDSQKAFAAIYVAFLGKAHGPRAGWFLLQYPKERVIQRLKEASKP